MFADLAFAISQLQAQVRRIVRRGVVVEVDFAAGLLRVAFEDTQELTESPWIPWATSSAGPGVWAWLAPEVGARVTVFAPNGDTEAAFAFGALPPDAGNAPSDDQVSVFQVGPLRVEVDGNSGDVNVSTSGTITMDTSELLATGEVVAQSGPAKVQLSTHKHNSGTGPTDSPTPNT